MDAGFPVAPVPHACHPRYFLRVTITRNYSANIIKEQDFLVQMAQEVSGPASRSRGFSVLCQQSDLVPSTQPPQDTCSIKMEVGIEDCLHIEFEYDKQK
jgi:vacuolar protein sorting-associated protein 26